MYDIIESKLLGKKSLEECEDGIFISSDIIAVIDGSTSKINKSFNNKKGGRIAMEVIKEALLNIDSSLKPKEKLDYLSKAIKDYKEINHITFPAIASLIFYDATYSAIVSYGDCRSLLNGNGIADDKLSDVVLGEKRSDYIKSFLEGGFTEQRLLEHDLSREYIMPYLLKQQSLANIEYPALDGSLINSSFIKSYSVKYADEVVLASDGYPKLFRTLKESEDYLNKIIKEDPLCYRLFKSTKGVYKGNISYDDRAYIRFKIC